MQILNDFLTDLEDNLNITLYRYNKDYTNNLKQNKTYHITEYWIRDIEFSINGIYNELIINPNIKLPNLIEDQDLYLLYTLPFVYKVNQNGLFLYEPYDTTNRFIYNKLDDIYKIKHVNNKTIFRIPVMQCLEIKLVDILDIKSIILSPYNQILRIYTYTDFLYFDINEIILKYYLPNSTKQFIYLSRFGLENTVINDYIDITYDILTPLVSSLTLLNKYPSLPTFRLNNNSYFFLINFKTNIKHIENYKPLKYIDIEIKSDYPIIYSDKLFLQLYISPKQKKSIKVFNTDIVKTNLSNNIVNIFNTNSNFTFDIKLFDTYSIKI